MRVRVVEPAREALAPLLERAVPVPRHVAARAAREPGRLEVAVRPVGELREVGARLLAAAVHEGVVLVGEERLLHPPLRPEHQPGVRRGRRAELVLRPAQDPPSSVSLSRATNPAITVGVEPAGEEAVRHVGDELTIPGEVERAARRSTRRRTARGPCVVDRRRSVVLSTPTISPPRSNGRWWTFASRSACHAS